MSRPAKAGSAQTSPTRSLVREIRSGETGSVVKGWEKAEMLHAGRSLSQDADHKPEEANILGWCSGGLVQTNTSIDGVKGSLEV